MSDERTASYCDPLAGIDRDELKAFAEDTAPRLNRVEPESAGRRAPLINCGMRIPNYVHEELRTRAFTNRTTIIHELLLAAAGEGEPLSIAAEDLIPDGRSRRARASSRRQNAGQLAGRD